MVFVVTIVNHSEAKLITTPLQPQKAPLYSGCQIKGAVIQWSRTPQYQRVSSSTGNIYHFCGVRSSNILLEAASLMSMRTLLAAYHLLFNVNCLLYPTPSFETTFGRTVPCHDSIECTAAALPSTAL